jgi:hypothetical protein
MIRSKIEEYLARAETLKTHLTAPEGKAKKAVGANGASKKGSATSVLLSFTELTEEPQGRRGGRRRC